MSIKARGENSWLIRVYIRRDKNTGKRIEYNETFHGSYEEATDREEELKEKATTGKLFAQPKMTVEELYERHYKVVRNFVSPRQIYTIREHYKYYVKNVIGHMNIDDVQTDHINLVIDEMLDHGLSTNMARKVYSTMNTVFNRAVKNKLLTQNPLDEVDVPKYIKNEVNYLTYEEAIRFDKVKSFFWYGSAFVFQLHTGLRNQEVMALRWSDIDFERCTLHVQRACVWLGSLFIEYGPTKTSKSNRFLPLDPEQIKLLRLHEANQKMWIEKRRQQGLTYQDESLIFATKDGRTPCIMVPRYNFKAMLRRAGINRSLRWYDLRHTYATYMMDSGVDSIYLAKLMGTSVKLLEETYVHVIPERQREATAAFVQKVPISMPQVIIEGAKLKEDNLEDKGKNGNL